MRTIGSIRGQAVIMKGSSERAKNAMCAPLTAIKVIRLDFHIKWSVQKELVSHSQPAQQSHNKRIKMKSTASILLTQSANSL